MRIYPQLVVSIACLCLVPPASGQISQAEGMQREANLNEWLNDSDLPQHLRAEASRIQSARHAVNSRGSQLGQKWQSFRSDVDRYNSNCAGRRMTTQSEKNSCENLRSNLNSNRARLQSEGSGIQSAAAPVSSAYESLRGAVQSHRAAQSGADQQSWHAAWSKGRADAIGCYPVNAHGYCSGAGGDYTSCQDGYSNGFNDGAASRDQNLERAYAQGMHAAEAGQENAGFGHPDGQGSCRTQWVQEYNRGHFEGRGS